MSSWISVVSSKVNPMKIPLTITMICMIALAVLVAGCTSPLQSMTIPSETPVVVTTPPYEISSTCGLLSCHGLNLACGPNPPQICTADYQLGDKCRQYAYCSNSGGTCSLITTQQFTTCKTCIEKCGGADPAEILTCEEKC